MPSPREDSRAAEIAAARSILVYPQLYVAEFPLSELEPYPGNPKDHDIGAIDESFSANGFLGVIYAQRRGWTPESGTKARVIAGHGRDETLRQRGVTHAPVLLIDCPDTVARRYVLADNEISRKGGYNSGALLDFLRSTDDLTGTGFDLDDVQSLHVQVNGPPLVEASEPASAAAEDKQFIVVVTCVDERAMQAVYEDLTARGLACKLVT